MEPPDRTAAAGALLAPAGLLLMAPSPASSARALLAAPPAADPTAPLVAAVALLAWLLTAWLLLTALLTLLSRAPGGAGCAAAALARRVAPATVRRLVALTLGVTVAAGTVAASPATATPALAAAPSAAAPLDGPPGPAVPDLDWPATPVSPDLTTGTAAVLPSPTSTGAAADAVVVRPGDTLWGLAERALAAEQQAPPTVRQVAASWPAWWSANREVVGDDPDLVLPGTALQPPADTRPPGPAPDQS